MNNEKRLRSLREETDDQALLQGLRDGDDERISVLYAKYYVMVLRLVAGNNGTEDEARDVFQDTLMVVYENVRKPAFVLTCGLQTYVYAIARRLWLKQLRRQGRFSLLKEEEERDYEEAASHVDTHLEKEADIAKMEKSIASLGEPCATLLRDFYVQGLSMDQIAEKFGYTNADNAKNQKYKCLQRLKRHFFESAGIAAEESEL